MVERLFSRLTQERLHLCRGDSCQTYGGAAENTPALEATVSVRQPRFDGTVVCGGSLGAAEAYLENYWETDDLVTLLRIMIRNRSVLQSLDQGTARLVAPFRRLFHWLRRNTPSGSKKNIEAHYDLGNDFFELFLDPTLAYSCGLFEMPTDSLEDASLRKFDRLCQLLHLSPDDHLLEIGTGWGGLALHAANRYGCRVTSTTISPAQLSYARQRCRQAGLASRIEILDKDYRDLNGTFDKIVSVEMIEAVGHEFLPTFFRKCDQLLKPGGRFALQAITIPDQRYDAYRHSVDFIQKYVFPGGALPSLGAIVDATKKTGSLQLESLQDFHLDYALTLEAWRQRFFENKTRIKQLGMSDRFLRMWDYYLAYCEAGFREHIIGLAQILFVKPQTHGS